MNNIKFEYLKDPEVFQINRLNAHSDHIYYTPYMKYEDLRILQNGNFKFFYAKNLNEVKQDFYKEGFDDKDWDLIKVPGHIQLLGYGNPQYVNTMYPWDGIEDIKPPNIPSEFNPVGLYAYEFDLPKGFQKDAAFICFEGVESAFYLWLNGEFIGYSEDTFTPSEFDLSSFIKEKGNRLCIMVVRFSSGSWLEDQDFFRFSGIFRDVYLYTTPKIHIYDMFVKPEVLEDLKKAELKCEFEIVNKENLNGFIYFKLYDENNTLIKVSEKLKVSKNVTLNASLDNINLWNAEIPYLYKLIVEICDDKGETIEIVEQKIGFRRFEMKDKLMLLNGKRIVFKGVNRHEFNARYGRNISKEDILWDIKCMKKNNINAVRTSHYPNQKELYSLCDEYGIYVIDEANIETHGTWSFIKDLKYENIVPCDNEVWKGAVIDRGNSMVQRDKNHPSILIWSCGNESFGGKVLYDLSNFYRNTDNSRLVHYEGVANDRRYNDTSDMESRMYLKPQHIKEYLENNPEKPYISCEYAHSMGNACGNLEKYTKLADEYSMYQGGFIWDFIDQAIYNKDPNGEEYLATGGDFFDRPNDAYFCGNGLVFADRKESPKMKEVKFAYRDVEIFCDENYITIINKNNWLNTDKYEFHFELLENGLIIKKGKFLLDLNPQSRKTLDLPCAIPDKNCEYILTVSMCLKEDEIWEKAGYELSFGQGVVKKAVFKEIVEKSSNVICGNENIGFKMKNSSCLYFKPIGKLNSIKSNNKEFILSEIKPDFWRAPIDNDLGNKNTYKWAKWKIASLYAFKTKEKLEDSKLYVTYDLNIDKQIQCEFLYEFMYENKFSLTFTLENSGELIDMPAFGFSFEMPSFFSNVKWYGRGPFETYQDRKHGAKIGIYENKVADNYTDYLNPQECGNKTDLRFIEITDNEGSGLRIFSEDLFECSVLPYTSHEIESAHHKNNLPKQSKTVVHVCKKKCGVGGDDAWGAPVHPEYLVNLEGKMSFKVYFEVN